MNKISLIIPFLLTVLTVNGQFMDSLIIKTHPLRDIVAQNPNIGFEKIINSKYSAEFEITYKNRDTESSGKEFDVWSYKSSTGGRVLFGLKRYLVNNKTIPNAWYFCSQLGYRYIYLSDFKKVELSGEYSRTVDITKQDFEFNILFGREFTLFKHFVSEFNIGIGLMDEIREEVFIEGTPDYKFGNGVYRKNYYGAIPYFNWSIGYLL